MSENRGPNSSSARIIYRDLLRFGPRPRTQLAARSGLSLPTVTRGTRELIADGLIRELPVRHQPGGKGRPQEPLDVVVDGGALFLGAKITADAVHVALTSVRAQPLAERSTPLTDTSPQHVLQVIGDLCAELMAEHEGVAGLGVSLAARVAHGGLVERSGQLGWTEPVPLGDVLSERLGIPVIADNDLRALLQGVHWFGPGRTFSSFALLTIGAGFATGVVHEGRIVVGRHIMAGLTERLVIGSTPDGEPITVGEVATTRALLARARERGLTVTDVPALQAARRAGHPVAAEVLDEMVRGVATACGALAALLDPEVILLGGENVTLLREQEELFLRTLRDRLHPDQHGLPVRSIGPEFDTWARGAATIAVQRYTGLVR